MSFSTGKQLSIFGSNIQTQLLYFDEFSENVNIILQMSPMTTTYTPIHRNEVLDYIFRALSWIESVQT
jgi:hypothetical protein